jgi:hypothetical protein
MLWRILPKRYKKLILVDCIFKIYCDYCDGKVEACKIKELASLYNCEIEYHKTWELAKKIVLEGG